MQTLTINGQQKKVGNFTVRWYLKKNQAFSVIIKWVSGEDVLKEWEFDTTPVNEAISYCWYDYVVRSMEQQCILGFRQIPGFLQDTSSKQADELVRMVFEKI